MLGKWSSFPVWVGVACGFSCFFMGFREGGYARLAKEFVLLES